MADAFAQTMVTKLETLLAANVGVQSVTVDGRSVSYADLTKQYDYWKRKLARSNGSRPRVAQVYIRGDV